MTADQPSGSSASTASGARLVVMRSPDSEAAQAYRSVRETLRHAQGAKPIRSILLADAGSRDSIGEAAANIGASFALNRNKTVLVDLDSGNPVLHQWLDTRNESGLFEWLAASSSDEAAKPVPVATGIGHLSVLPARAHGDETAQASIADLLTDDACEHLISALSESARYVIFHGSMAPVSSQALTAAAHVDAVVLIVRSGTTRRSDAQRAKEALQRVGANLLGVVLTESS
jgi:Mrp family chromosome partitioning ATPase